MATAYPEDRLRNLREKIEILPVLKAINYRLDTIQEVGDAVKSFCPIHGEAVFRTLVIDRKTRRYRCSYSLCPGNKGGDLVDLFAKALKIDYDEAVQRLIQSLRIPVDLPPTEDLLRKTLEVAENYLALASYNDALAGLKKVLAAQPDNLRALKGMLVIHRARNEETERLAVLGKLLAAALNQEQYALASDYCREILEKSPNDTEVRLQYIQCLIGQKEMHRALEEYMRLADYFESRQEFDRALEVYRKIEQLNLDIIDVYPHIIQLMVVSDRTKDAVEESLRKAADHERRGDHEQALECYRAVLEMDKSRTDVHERLIDAAIHAGLDEAKIEESLTLVEGYIGAESYAAALKVLEKLRKAAPKHAGITAKYVEVLRRQSRDVAATEAQLELTGQLIEQGRTEEALVQLRSIGATADLSLDSLKRLASAQSHCGLMAEAAETYATIADRLADEKRFEEAADIYEKVVEINPERTSYRRRQIELYQRSDKKDRVKEKRTALLELAIAQKRWDEADALLRQALETAPDDLELLEYQVRILAGAGRTGEAQVRYMALAQRAVASGQWNAAKRILQRVLAAEPDYLDAALLLADVGIAQSDTRIAREHLQKIAPELLCHKDYVGAKTAFSKLHEMAPDDVPVLVHLAAVFGNLGEEERLLDTYRNLVTAYIANQAYPKAIEYCTAILDRDPENIWALEQMIRIYEKTEKTRSIPEVSLRLARIYEKLDDVDRVQEYYARALEIEPTNTQARTDYVQFLVGLRRWEAASNQAQIVAIHLTEQNRLPEAIQIIEGLVEHISDDVVLRRLLIELCQKAGMEREFVTQCTQLINLHYRRNEFPEVINLYRDLLVREPNNVTFRTHLIDALVRLKRRDEAIEQYFELASYYIRNEAYEDAESTLLDLLNQSPANPRALDMLVEILIKAGRQEEATKRARELSEIYVAAGKNDKAIGVLQRVLAFDPENQETTSWIAEITRSDQSLRALVEEPSVGAAASWSEGKRPAAVETPREAARFQASDTAVSRRLAEMYAGRPGASSVLDEQLRAAMSKGEQGDYREALQTVDDILGRDPSHYAARRFRAELLTKMGDQQRALEELIRLTPPTETPASFGELPRGIAPALAGRQSEALQVVSDFTFDNFVIGDRNRFAHATALAVAKAPAMHYNPLFLYGDVGLGKTHLVSAIANYIVEHQPDLRILYTSSEEFTSQLVDAIQNNTINAFRSRYKTTDVLLMDDIQFLTGKERAQEEFFHIFNTLFQSKRQIVMTSDRPPKEIEHLEKRLKSRFGSGVIVDIQAPDLETRAAIIKKELTLHADVQIDNRLINLIAEQINTNVRELKGALKQVLVKHELSHADINEELVRQVLEIYAET
jgi:tetratricopeptide (TPR) repeat protein